MRAYWKDSVSSLLFLAGAITVFAKLQEYSWWFLNSWKSALAVLAALGLGILLLDIAELARSEDLFSFFESVLWVITATVVVGNLFAQTTQIGFLVSAGLLAITWATQLVRHINEEIHHGTQGSRYAPVH